MTRRGKGWAIAAVVLTVLVLMACVALPIPYVARSPGPVFDILGENDGKPVLEISDSKQYPTTGQLDMTTVAESGGSSGPLSVGAAIWGLFDPVTSITPDEHQNEPDDREYEEAVFDASQSNAVGAAADFLERPVTVQPVVMEVLAGSAADGLLEPGDIVISVNGHKVVDREEIGKIIAARPAGSDFVFKVLRQDEPVEKTVRSRPDPDEPSRAVVGIVIDNHYKSDFTATVNLDNIGGPSAGLMLSLGMVDRLTPQDLLKGRHVAGTGTIDGHGVVGDIGGIDKKMIAAQSDGAELFIAPAKNCPDVVTSTPAGLTVVPVDSLSEAVAAIGAWQHGDRLATCPVAADTSGTG